MDITEVKKANIGMEQKSIEATEYSMLEFVTQTEKEFEDAVLDDYSSMMTILYRKYANTYGQDEIRIKVLKIITNHVLSRINDTNKAKERKILKYQQIKKIMAEKGE